MAKTIALITFKDIPDKKYRIIKATDHLCCRKNKLCAFFHVDGCHRHPRREMCDFADGHIFLPAKK